MFTTGDTWSISTAGPGKISASPRSITASALTHAPTPSLCLLGPYDSIVPGYFVAIQLALEAKVVEAISLAKFSDFNCLFSHGRVVDNNRLSRSIDVDADLPTRTVCPLALGLIGRDGRHVRLPGWDGRLQSLEPMCHEFS